MMLIALVNQSKRITAADMQVIADAGSALASRISRAWEIGMVHLRVTTKASEAELVARFVDKDAGDGTEAFHDEESGRPFIEVDVSSVLDAGGGVIDDKGTGLNVVGTFGHELGELMCNPFCQGWVSMPDGRFVANEVGDPGESQPFYVIGSSGQRVLTSNIVTPRYFDAQAPSGVSLDLAGAMRAPFENAGYQIIYDPSKLATKGGPISDVFAAERYHPAKLAFRQKRNAASAGRFGRYERRSA